MMPDGHKVPHPTRVDQIRPEHLDDGALSLVVFGPGRGEAMVVLLPDGRVGVVDGCREPSSPDTGRGDPVREFLSALEQRAGLRGETFRIAFVCLTHPHDDHYAGLGRLLEAYRGRVDAVWSVPEVGDRYAEALRSFVEVTHAGREPLPDDVKIRGLKRVLAELVEAHERQGSSFRHVAQGKRLLSTVIQSNVLELSACGPADVDVKHAQFALVEGLELLLAEGEHSARFDPNVTSGALLIRWGQAGMLLGGDLLCKQGRHLGWDEVCGDIHPPIQVIKVAHHASVEAHHEGLWRRLGVALAIVTPFKDAKGTMPPRPEQITRLAQDAVVAITSVPAWPRRAGVPQAVYSTAQASRSRRSVTSARNRVLSSMSPPPGEADTRNAVAVSLDATGKLLRFVLAGRADVYEPPTPTGRGP